MPMQTRGRCQGCHAEDVILDNIYRMCSICRPLKSEREFRQYLLLHPDKGGRVDLSESSLAGEGAHCWLRMATGKMEGISALLSVAEAEQVAAALHEFIDEARDGLLTEPAT